ncbi:glycosyltransferase [Erwinia sp. BC051422]|uniref:glycosyltransferase family 8 protein n=1 Tax=Erwinia wuhanensis TaxID=3045167 RepID=UPI00264FE372|nr:glycosyltransferase [Erwinia sp. BC051422]MDN8543365.1 glycosyltransferase [Erwinia sp. BC051422]
MKAGSFERIIDEAFLEKNVSSDVVVAGNGGDARPVRHIVLGVDGSFLRHAFITMQSIIEASRNEVFSFHLITDENVSHLTEKFNTLLAATFHTLTVHKIASTLFADFPTTQLFTKATYYRLLAPHFLKDVDLLLYLDADIVCLNAFETLWHFAQDKQQPAFVVLEDESLRAELAKNVTLTSDRYFNAGVMLINVPRWREERISLQTFAVLSEKGATLQYLDQDALNIVLENRFATVDSKYNTIFKPGHGSEDYTALPPPETVFLHYAGADKPWQQWNKQAVCSYYSAIYRRSVWADRAYDLPKNDRQAKKMYKLMFREKKFLKGLKWYITYYLFRYLK